MARSESPTSRLARLGASYAVLLLLGTTMALPFVWTLLTSLKQEVAVFTGWLPSDPSLANYGRVFDALPFGRFYLNSAIVAIFVTIGQVFTSSLAAYAFARLRFRGRDALFLGYLATMMIPRDVTMIPVFILMRKLPVLAGSVFGTTYFGDDVWFLNRWYAGQPLGLNSYFALIAPGMFSAYGTFMLRQFFLSISHEIEEAATIDGCGLWGVYWRIVLPLSKPALATLTIFTFLGSWRSFIWPLVMTSSEEMMTLPVGLSQLISFYVSEYTMIAAGSIVMLVPMMVVFVLGQRWFVRGIQLGAVKG